MKDFFKLVKSRKSSRKRERHAELVSASFITEPLNNQIPKQVRNDERASKFGTDSLQRSLPKGSLRGSGQWRNSPLDGLSSNTVREEIQRGEKQNCKKTIST